MSHTAFSHNVVIAHQGDPSEHCWLILDGSVRIQLISCDGQRAQLAYHGPGEVFGAYPDVTTHRADIITSGDTEVLRIATSTIAAVAADHASVAYGLSRLFARQLDMALDRMAARATLTAAGRVYSELMRLVDADNIISLVPTVTALAMGANTSRETASRAITALERRGIVKRDGQMMTVQAPRMLKELIF
ncbi:Crp/Fnr family transcriptional regulator [Sphingomonas crocodyli]|uniref:Crp/Fnr family transcriptional regulator n=2 Tax=Sphingomonas crocodyli TaxID=1979270 RepID=A0A437LYZ0_9SPHN|nr:Crp/Fnr family transcriptional regulator [Sphingomonas crocodyli]